MDEPHRAGAARRWRRMRWRHSGAWLWPTFAAATVLEMGILHWQPVQGDATSWVGGLIGAGCLNLIAVVLVGGIGGVLLRRRRSDLPKVVADDYAGTVALLVVAAGLLAAGLVHRPAIADRHAAFAEQSLAVREWVAIHGDAYERAHVSASDSLLIDDDLYRTCVPTPDPKRFDCLIVDTSRPVARIRLDDSGEPNALLNPRGGLR
ncbi:MAG TPA: hypothetical protein VHZ31_02730 [Solirubrobacteraceae bacterium]|jgi:hypothetical protein|nr:hypothetical protein [Solirubrobacteraceae bacterium]